MFKTWHITLILPLCTVVSAGVDRQITQNGSPSGFGNRYELTTKSAVRRLTTENNQLSIKVDVLHDPFKGSVLSTDDSGEVLQDTGIYRRIYDRLSQRNTLQIIWLNDAEMDGSAWFGNFGRQWVWPDLHGDPGWWRGGIGGGGAAGGAGGGGSAGKEPDLEPPTPEIDPPPDPDKFNREFFSIPTPGAGPMALAIGGLAWLVPWRRRSAR
jgi:hypothetical protein